MSNINKKEDTDGIMFILFMISICFSIIIDLVLVLSFLMNGREWFFNIWIEEWKVVVTTVCLVFFHGVLVISWKPTMEIVKEDLNDR